MVLNYILVQGTPAEFSWWILCIRTNRQLAKISQLCSPYLKYHLDLILFFSLNKKEGLLRYFHEPCRKLIVLVLIFARSAIACLILYVTFHSIPLALPLKYTRGEVSLLGLKIGF